MDIWNGINRVSLGGGTWNSWSSIHRADTVMEDGSSARNWYNVTNSTFCTLLMACVAARLVSMFIGLLTTVRMTFSSSMESVSLVLLRADKS